MIRTKLNTTRAREHFKRSTNQNLDRHTSWTVNFKMNNNNKTRLKLETT